MHPALIQQMAAERSAALYAAARARRTSAPVKSRRPLYRRVLRAAHA